MRRIMTGIIMVLLTVTISQAEDMSLEKYIEGFDYAARKEMKINSEKLIDGIADGSVQLVDIRFKEEFEAWRMGFAVNIPLNELPRRFNELNKDKMIVTACPHKDRAIIAMTYLKTKGFKVKYLVDGLTGLAESLRGDNARELIEIIGSPQSNALSEISKIRKMIRASCYRIKNNAAPSVETQPILVLWRQFIKDYGHQASWPYMGHPDWNKALRKIEDSLVTMKAAKNTKKALPACGQTCLRFVELNEKAGVVDAADILYKFRKKAKPLQKSVKSKDFDTIVAAIDTLSVLRNRALSVAASHKKQTAQANSDIHEFSKALDIFSESARSGDKKNIGARYLSMMSKMEIAYDQLL